VIAAWVVLAALSVPVGYVLHLAVADARQYRRR
jgi:hypothetical protein